MSVVGPRPSLSPKASSLATPWEEKRGWQQFQRKQKCEREPLLWPTACCIQGSSHRSGIGCHWAKMHRNRGFLAPCSKGGRHVRRESSASLAVEITTPILFNSLRTIHQGTLPGAPWKGQPRDRTALWEEDPMTYKLASVLWPGAFLGREVAARAT